MSSLEDRKRELILQFKYLVYLCLLFKRLIIYYKKEILKVFDTALTILKHLVLLIVILKR